MYPMLEKKKQKKLQTFEKKKKKLEERGPSEEHTSNISA